MVSNNLVKFLVNREQLARLKANASSKGHKTLSAYLRDISLNEDIPLTKILLKLHSIECQLKQLQNERTKP